MYSEILVVGDIHGYWSPVNALLNQKKPKIILQCGDFGYWPKWNDTTTIMVENDFSEKKLKPFDQYGLKNENCSIFWCDGNHEDHESLAQIVTNNKLEIQPNIFYQPRGSTITLPDGRRVLFIGGAQSVDKMYRTPGIDWFSDEAIKLQDLDKLPDTHIDIIISHTTPKEFYSHIENKLPTECTKKSDSSMEALSFVLQKYKPDLWYFSHFHISANGYYGNTRWFCVNMVGQSNWWVPLANKNN